MSRRERMARVLWTEALDGDLKAAQLIAAYTDGRPVQPVAVGAAVRFTADEYGKAAAMVEEWRGARGAETTVATHSSLTADRSGPASGRGRRGRQAEGRDHCRR